MLGFQLAEAFDGGTDRLVIGQHAAQPAMADIGHAGPLRLLLDNLARGALGADKQHLVLVGRQATHEIQRCVEGRYGVLKVDDVNLVAGTKYVLTHLGVPVAGLVTEMCACLQQFAHAYLRHNSTYK